MVNVYAQLDSSWSEVYAVHVTLDQNMMVQIVFVN